MDPLLAEGERTVAAALGGVRRLAVEDLRAWQERNAALKAKMGCAVPGDFLAAGDLPDWMTLAFGGTDYVLLPEGFGEHVVDPRRRLEELFDRVAGETYRQLAASLAVLVAVLAVLFRRRFAAFVAPVAAAIAATAGTLGWIGEPVGFFQLVCFFILAGLGIDYAVFHRGGTADAGVRRVVLFSFLTSLVGFGMLGFTSFPVTRTMGLTLGSGLAFAYLFSLAPDGGSRPDGAGVAWHEQREQSAGAFRIALMWHIYRVLGKSAAKVLFLPAWPFIYPFCRAGRAAVRQFYGVLGVRGRPFRHLLNFAWSLLDKTDACTLRKDLPRMALRGDGGWREGGCFLLSSHLGCIEVLSALGSAPDAAPPRVHAFRQMGHDRVFTRMLVRHRDPRQFELHAVEDIGVETAVEMKSAVERGEIVLMAGDRPSAGSAAVLRHAFLGRECVWPKGVFRFAELMECPVYAIACVRTGWNAYEVRASRLDPSGGAASLLDGYVGFLEREARAFPDQWYQFYRFFPEDP